MKPISGKALCKLLEARGWILARIRGSHHIYKKPGETALLTVPVHGRDDLKTGAQTALMRQAGLTEADLTGTAPDANMDANDNS